MTMKLPPGFDQRQDFEPDLAQQEQDDGRFPVDLPPKRTSGGVDTPGSALAKFMAQERKGLANSRGESIAYFNSLVSGGEPLTAMVRVVSPAEVTGTSAAPNPWAGIPWPGTLPASLAQSIMAMIMVQFGFDGVNEKFLMNLPLNQWMKMPFVGNDLRLNVATTQRYFPLLASVGLGGAWLHATDDLIRNNIFDNAQTLPLTGPVGFPAAGDVIYRGLISRGVLVPGSSNQDRSSRPQRRFAGWVPTGSADGLRFRCPVPRGAVAVTLLSDASTATHDTNIGQQLFFSQKLLNGQIMVNFLPDLVYQLQGDTSAIDVYPTAIANHDTPFELVYELGF